MARRQHGPLTIEEISKGLGACVDNINALVLDAEALLQADRPARALTCLLVAGQEMGKVQFLQAMLTFESDDLDRWKEILKAFYNHRSKAAGGLLGLLGPTTPSSVVGSGSSKCSTAVSSTSISVSTTYPIPCVDNVRGVGGVRIDKGFHYSCG